MDATILKQLIPMVSSGTFLIFVFWKGAERALILTAAFAHQKHRTNISAQNLHDIKLIAKYSAYLYWGFIAFTIIVVEALKGVYQLP